MVVLLPHSVRAYVYSEPLASHGVVRATKADLAWLHVGNVLEQLRGTMVVSTKLWVCRKRFVTENLPCSGTQRNQYPRRDASASAEVSADKRERQ
jgi:hypothetical protein